MRKSSKKHTPEKRGFDKMYNKKDKKTGKIFTWIMLILILSSVVLSLGFALYSYFGM
ncbi:MULTISPECIES: MerR family transcriptional regulator [Lactobacillales]|uniref:MerR family transcriptional regulator n=1 Tax=Lactobacillales TaxID=186826 RepID=UPI000B311BFA|nr:MULTISPECIES: MerR family transcriptional regulator [Lactobacillales]MEB7389175.1 MerR family transcriptional regulator [Aerococcus viridans]